MTNTEQKIFEIIKRSRNKAARTQYIARFSGTSSEYTSLICQSLHRRGYINFAKGLATLAVANDAPSGPPAEEPADVPEETEETSEETTDESETAREEGQPEEEIPQTPNNPADFTGQATPISSIGSLKEDKMAALENAGYRTVGDLAEAPIAKLMSAGGMNVKQAADLINQARGKFGMLD